MNDPALLASRLGELISLAKAASNGFERATVYAAAQAIKGEFDAGLDNGDIDAYAFEKAANACWHLCAAIGYDVDNGHSAYDHLSWAAGQHNTLENVLRDSSRK